MTFGAIASQVFIGLLANGSELVALEIFLKKKQHTRNFSPEPESGRGFGSNCRPPRAISEVHWRGAICRLSAILELKVTRKISIVKLFVSFSDWYQYYMKCAKVIRASFVRSWWRGWSKRRPIIAAILFLAELSLDCQFLGATELLMSEGARRLFVAEPRRFY